MYRILSLYFCLLIISCKTNSNDESGTAKAVQNTIIEETKKDEATLPPSTPKIKNKKSIATNNLGEQLNPNTPAETYNHTLTKIPTSHDCKVKGLAMEDNQLWIPEEQIWVCIVADKETHDSDFGDSYRLLDIYDTKNCTTIDRKTLPVNQSPDFPWYLYPNTYDTKNKIVGIQGYEFVYIFDVEHRQLSPRLKPTYLTERTAFDAQSGMPYGLAITGQYLFGYAQDFGAYAFHLKDKKNIQPLLPIIEEKVKDQHYLTAVFLLENKDNTHQIIIPSMDIDNGVLALENILEQPTRLDIKTLKKLGKGKIYYISTTDNSGGIALDFNRGRIIQLPKELSNQADVSILSFVKKAGGKAF